MIIMDWPFVFRGSYPYLFLYHRLPHNASVPLLLPSSSAIFRCRLVKIPLPTPVSDSKHGAIRWPSWLVFLFFSSSLYTLYRPLQMSLSFCLFRCVAFGQSQYPKHNPNSHRRYVILWAIEYQLMILKWAFPNHNLSTAKQSWSFLSFVPSRWRPHLQIIISTPTSSRIFYFLLLNLAYMGVQMGYGVITNSLGLISDGKSASTPDYYQSWLVNSHSYAVWLSRFGRRIVGLCGSDVETRRAIHLWLFPCRNSQWICKWVFSYSHFSFHHLWSHTASVRTILYRLIRTNRENTGTIHRKWRLTNYCSFRE